MYFPWPPVETALSTETLVPFVIKDFFLKKELIKRKEIVINFKSSAL